MTVMTMTGVASDSEIDWHSGNTAPSLGEASRVAEVTATGDLRATGHRIPRCIGPLD